MYYEVWYATKIESIVGNQWDSQVERRRCMPCIALGYDESSLLGVGGELTIDPAECAVGVLHPEVPKELSKFLLSPLPPSTANWPVL